MKNTLCCLILALAGGHAAAQSTSPVGLWKTFDVKTGKPKALVRVVETNGTFIGRIETLFRSTGEVQNPLCTRCTDARKGQPILGMVILSGMKREDGMYVGGQLLNPEDGGLYKSTMVVAEGGGKLLIHAYVGLPMFGKTRNWSREEPAMPPNVDEIRRAD